MKYQELIKQLTIEEKASLMSGKDFWQTQNIDRLNIPSIFLADGPNGIRKQKAAADHLGLNESIPATCFPTSASIANSWNPLLAESMATLLGAEAVAQNVNVVLGPGINIKRNPLAGRNFEYYSEDPYLAGKLGAAFIRGVQTQGIAASVKHFAANNQELRRMSIDSVVDERALREIYLTPFEIAIKEGKVKTVMAAYNLINGIYANEHPQLLQNILRNEWNYKGIVVSDWGGMNDRVAALKVGAELEMPTSGVQTTKEIIEAINNKTLKEETLDLAVDRLLTLIYDTSNSIKNSKSTFDVELHHMMAQKAAEESMVLLKNKDNILPLLRHQKVAIIGDFAAKARFQGAGSSGVNPTKVDSILNQIYDTDFKLIGYEKGFHRYGRKSKRLINKAINLSNKADIVLLFLGLDEYSETEGLDRDNFKLPQNQLDLIAKLSKHHKNIVAVLSCGSVIDMNWDNNVKAVLHTYLPGQAGSRAILDLLTGAFNPSGKLAESYPFEYNDILSSKYFPGTENTVEYRESLFVGYRFLDTAKIPIKYPFGHGLSYTKYLYSDLTISEDKVSFKVSNIGGMVGKEISQLYIGKKDTKIIRPLKELKGFAKEKIEPNETKNISIYFDDYTFRYYNTKTNSWEIEPGKYEIYVGSSSKDIHLSGEITIKGTTNKLPYDINDFKTYKNISNSIISDNEFEQLLGTKIPNPHFIFYKKNRMIVDYNTTVQQLRYSKGWFGRFFAWGIRFGYKFMLLIGKRKTANVMQMGLFHNPMRNMSRLTGGAITWGQLDGLIMMFNGKFFKGLLIFLKNKKRIT